MTDAPTTQTGWNTATLAAALLCAAAAVYLFGFMGNSHDPARYGGSVISWVTRQWDDPGSRSGHGWFIPAVSLWLAWQKRKELAAAAGPADARALVVIVPALILYWAGYRAQQTRMGVFSLILLAWSVPWYLYGVRVARLLAFPGLYLVFALPMGFLTAATLPLRLLSCKLAAFLLNGMGVAVIRTGTMIRSADPAGFGPLDVAEPCSGLQYLIAMAALTAAYAYVFQKSQWKRWVLFLSSLPLAIAGNAARIVAIGFLADALSMNLAMKVYEYHVLSGCIVFGVAVLMMVGLDALLSRNPRSLLKTWLPDAPRR